MSGGAVPRPVRTVLAVAVVLVLVLCATGCDVGADPAPEVRTPSGALRGTDDGSVQRYRGIRYAQPPVGPLRWSAPVPAGPWDGTLDAVAPGPRCPQRTPGAPSPVDEDCLFLDVTTPSDRRPDERLPVVVWWHGGGFLTGSGADYDAGRLAGQGRVVVVTVNYRLGVFGYFGLPGLPGSGSFGLADQLESLRWTRENIAAFGGDPASLTVAGQSAGGLSACALLTSPRLASAGVRRVAVMSGPCSLDWPAGGAAAGVPAGRSFAPVSTIEQAGRDAAAALGCTGPDTVGCLRSRPARDLLDLGRSFDRLGFGSDLLPSDPASALRTADPAVPVLYGGTRDEARAFVRPARRADPDAVTPTTYPTLLRDAFGPAAGAVAAQYPLSAYGGSAPSAWATVLTDRSWACPTLRDEETLAARGPTYAYEFGDATAATGPDELPAGAQHGADLPMLFDLGGRDLLTARDRDLADLMIGYWSSFARTGRPEAPDGPRWDPVVPGAAPRPLQLAVEGVTPVASYDRHRCGFWDAARVAEGPP